MVMFFGLCNSLATFQTMMNDIFHDMPTIIVYIDDILIFTKDEKGHDEIVLEVLRRLKENDLFVKPKKCFFKVQEVEMLGLIIGPDVSKKGGSNHGLAHSHKGQGSSIVLRPCQLLQTFC